jgi:hypothetical protein
MMIMLNDALVPSEGRGRRFESFRVRQLKQADTPAKQQCPGSPENGKRGRSRHKALPVAGRGSLSCERHSSAGQYSAAGATVPAAPRRPRAGVGSPARCATGRCGYKKASVVIPIAPASRRRRRSGRRASQLRSRRRQKADPPPLWRPAEDKLSRFARVGAQGERIKSRSGMAHNALWGNGRQPVFDTLIEPMDH